MRLTIVVADDLVIIDGFGLRGAADLSVLPPNVHAIQWDNDAGHIEYVDDTPNLAIVSITDLQPIIDSFTARKFEIDNPPPKTKEQIWLEIKSERDTRKDGGFKVEVTAGVFKWFHSDESSRIQQLGLIISGAAVPAIPWKTMDGTFVTMTPTIAQAIFHGAFALDGALFARAEQHRAAMEASEAPADYDYSTGWPERFSDAV